MRMKVLLVVYFVVILNMVREYGSQADSQVLLSQNDNQEPFQLLCRIYNFAKNPPIKPVDTKEYKKMVDDIDALSAAANGREGVNTQTEEARSAQTQLIGITNEAHKLLDEIKKVNPEGEAERARNTFHQAISGEHGKEGDLSHVALRGVTGSRPVVCGSNNQGKGTSAGKNLIVDFFCICVNHEESYNRVDKVCGVSVGRGNVSGWGGTNLHSAATMWEEIKKGCGTFAQQGVTSTQDGHSLHHDFLAKIKEGGKVKVKNSETVHKTGMLGTAVSETGKNDFNCNGQGSTNRHSGSGSCVFYGDGKWEEDIEWLKKFKTGLETIVKLNNQTASWKSKLTTLQRQAQVLHGKVKANTQLEEEDTDDSPLAQHPNPDENENADSATQSQRHSHLAWALLLQ
ncbi:Variant surface glycoprotein [Trypanosoma congolense IL3000]|uniref:Variant surface glycoprotein n=1 Tax=Trypanosoma congolense (strain IL3000) TaxID=1068625 RepID=F9WAC3_TRYCI|nr:Variant surface glycoprotein [Trypanosoma congolense IL3000]